MTSTVASNSIGAFDGKGQILVWNDGMIVRWVDRRAVGEREIIYFISESGASLLPYTFVYFCLTTSSYVTSQFHTSVLLLFFFAVRRKTNANRRISDNVIFGEDIVRRLSIMKGDADALENEL